eukprot:scaffold40163_cov80-Phaeocystis_antarctica.AAC.2
MLRITDAASTNRSLESISQTLRCSTATTAGHRAQRRPPSVVAMLDVLPREAVARSQAPTDPRGQERAIGGPGELRPTNAAAFHEQTLALLARKRDRQKVERMLSTFLMLSC